jgi:hypothetical protein
MIADSIHINQIQDLEVPVGNPNTDKPDGIDELHGVNVRKQGAGTESRWYRR